MVKISVSTKRKMQDALIWAKNLHGTGGGWIGDGLIFALGGTLIGYGMSKDVWILIPLRLIIGYIAIRTHTTHREQLLQNTMIANYFEEKFTALEKKMNEIQKNTAYIRRHKEC